MRQLIKILINLVQYEFYQIRFFIETSKGLFIKACLFSIACHNKNTTNLMGSQHPQTIKVATANYSGITDSPFEFESNGDHQIKQLENIFLNLFEQLILALDENDKREKDINKIDKSAHLKRLGGMKDQAIKSFMKSLEEMTLKKFQEQYNDDKKKVLRKFQWGINQLDKNMHKGRYCPQYRTNVGIQNGRFNSMATFFDRWNNEFQKNIAYSKVKSSEYKKQKQICLVYDYLIYKSIVEYCYTKHFKSEQPSIKPRKQIEENPQKKDRNSTPEIKKIRRKILVQYENFLKKYHSLPYLKHSKKYEPIKRLIEANEVTFLQDISDQLINSVKAEGDYTIINKLKGNPDDIIIINKTNSRFINIYDAAKITGMQKLPNGQKNYLYIQNFNYKYNNNGKVSQYLPAVCFIDDYMFISLRFTSKDNKCIQIFQFAKHMLLINQKFPQLKIVIGGDFNCDATDQESVVKLLKNLKNKQDRMITNIEKDIQNYIVTQQDCQKIGQFNKVFDKTNSGITTNKKRTWLQSQWKKSEDQDLVKRDFLLSNHQLSLASNNIDKQSKESILLPNSKHPFDHFFIEGKIDIKNKYLNNQNPNPSKSKVNQQSNRKNNG